ncbi:MAG: 50S ribosomal protein L24 [Candidatus Doudnabacteria bacterium]|nr:50S ribosomal protein L24 [Candidatus Doudnabacteria bacterium]
MTHIRKGDEVKVLAGKERGRKGKVAKLNLKTLRAVVEGLNIKIRHQRPRKAGEKGQKVQLPASIHISVLMVVCPHCGKTTRAGHERDEKGAKFRICKKCGKRI